MPPLALPSASPRRGRFVLLPLAALAILTALAPTPADAQPTHLPALDADALIVEDSFGIPTVCAASEHDAFVLLGYLHARDRFFQMDTLRRLFSGTLAELLGPAALPSDVQLRTLGLRRAAERSQTAYSELAGLGISSAGPALESYSAGVNRYLASAPLPPEYGALEISAAEPWTPLDSITMAKGLAFGLSFDLEDIDRTLAFLTYSGTGQVFGFDGAALFSEDVFRSAPFDDRVSIPGALPSSSATAVPGAAAVAPQSSFAYDGGLADLARRYRETAAAIPTLAAALTRGEAAAGSNWWLLSGSRTASGHPILANDPHLALDTPSTFYEAHLVVSPQPRCGLPQTSAAAAVAFAGGGADGSASDELNVAGVSFAGVPGIVQGCNERICWGSTVNPMDVTDVYQEQVVFDQGTGLPRGTLYQGQEEPLVLIPQLFLVNQIGDGVPDNLAPAPLGPTEGGLTLVVPRRNHGPIVQLDLSAQPALGISVQYTGWSPTVELTAFLGFMRAGTVNDFGQALQFFDFGSQNWAVADVDGNIAYFTSAEMPLREDLQTLNAPDGGVPPFLIRDGSGALRHEWLALAGERPVDQALQYEILPFAEMPQIVNPASGFIVNANNDPIGTTLDNNPLNQLRPGGGLYYLSPGYVSLRVGRIDREIQDLLAGGHQATVEELAALQGNNELLDAELLLPHLLDAHVHAGEAGVPPELQALGTDPEITEAIARLRSWDFSTPTGIPEGYDPGDDPQNLPAPSAEEVADSVAATLWSTWRGQAVGLIIDEPLQGIGLGGALPGSRAAYVALDHLLTNFSQGQGVGASGLRFFPAPAVYTAAQARDWSLLRALRQALDLLASEEMGPVFHGSTDQNSYQWGKLHRITFDHLLGPPFSIPPAAGYSDPSSVLPGIPRSGGYEAVDASSHSARADGPNEFRFGSGPARRFIGVLDPAGIDAQQVIPGGQSGVLGHPHYADQLPLWLTNHYHPLRLSAADVAADAVSEQDFTATLPPCVPGPSVLCLQDDRFRVTVDWATGQGTSGPAGLVPAASDRSGIFWFFNPDNWEMLIKVLDGCAVNDHFWVFAASATNVEWELTVEDLGSGESFVRTHALGPASPAITDTRAFATCP